MTRATLIKSLVRLHRFLKDLESDEALTESNDPHLKAIAADAEEHRHRLHEVIPRIKRHMHD